jgi:hypothetical protein
VAPARLPLTQRDHGEGAKKRKSTTSYQGDEVESNARPSTEFVGLISTCFANHMGPYVKQERRNMNSKLDELKTNDEVDEDMKTFSTSYNLFGYMHNSIKRCCNYNTGQAFYDLQLEYKRWVFGVVDGLLFWGQSCGASMVHHLISFVSLFAVS